MTPEQENEELFAIMRRAQRKHGLLDSNEPRRAALVGAMLVSAWALDLVTGIVEPEAFGVGVERAVFDQIVAKAVWLDHPEDRLHPVAMGVEESGFDPRIVGKWAEEARAADLRASAVEALAHELARAVGGGGTGA